MSPASGRAVAPPNPAPPVVRRMRIRYAKRGRLRFVSHRDFARAFERALRRAKVPMAYSSGFNPHPRISYVGAAPTGAASEAEYLEIGLAEDVDPEQLRQAVDAALPTGLDLVECVPAGPGSLAERIDASYWRVELSETAEADLRRAVDALRAAETAPVSRLMKSGHRTIDARAAIVRIDVVTPDDAGSPGAGPHEPPTAPTAPTASERFDTPGDRGADQAIEPLGTGTISAADRPASGRYAILDVVVRQVTPAVRPDDVIAALHAVADLAPSGSPLASRLAQGLLDDSGRLADPLGSDRAAVLPAREGVPGPTR